MFTGIIETMAQVSRLESQASNLNLYLQSPLASQLKIDQSVAHNGVCLTVVSLSDDGYVVTAVAETLSKTNLGKLQVGSCVNLERCLPATGRFDGHFVQGHVDEVGYCTRIQEQDGSWLFDFEYSPDSRNITVEKGSICINGVSLTCFNSGAHSFSVAIIPYTYQHTTFQHLKVGDMVNLEFDIIGKYLQKLTGNMKF